MKARCKYADKNLHICNDQAEFYAALEDIERSGRRVASLERGRGNAQWLIRSTARTELQGMLPLWG